MGPIMINVKALEKLGKKCEWTRYQTIRHVEINYIINTMSEKNPWNKILFFEMVNKIGSPLAKLTKRKRKNIKIRKIQKNHKDILLRSLH